MSIIRHIHNLWISLKHTDQIGNILGVGEGVIASMSQQHWEWCWNGWQIILGWKQWLICYKVPPKPKVILAKTSCPHHCTQLPLFHFSVISHKHSCYQWAHWFMSPSGYYPPAWRSSYSKETKRKEIREANTNFEPFVQGFAWRWIESHRDRKMASLFHLNNNWGLSPRTHTLIKERIPNFQLQRDQPIHIDYKDANGSLTPDCNCFVLSRQTQDSCIALTSNLGKKVICAIHLRRSTNDV